MTATTEWDQRIAPADPEVQLSNGSSQSHQPQNTKALSLSPVQVPARESASFLPAMTIEQALERRDLLVKFISSILVKDVDYGPVPGGDRPTLKKPGAQKLASFFGLVPEFKAIHNIEDWDGDRHNGEPFFHYHFKCRLYRDAQPVGEGEGSCNSRESKYRYRTAERVCPECGQPTIKRSKPERGDGWYCFARIGGCGAQYLADDPHIVRQRIGRIPNPDIADSVNTILKQACKRSYVEAVLNTTGASQFFTQDLDDERPVWDLENDPDPRGRTVDTGNAPYGSKQAAQNVAERKLNDFRAEGRIVVPWNTKEDRLRYFEQAREEIGEVQFFEILKFYEASSISALFRSYNNTVEAYTRIEEIRARNRRR